MPSAEILTIGTELLLGQLVDTNTAHIARGLADVGMDVHRETSVGDNVERIATAVREALARSDAVVCAGGLGPTVDDLTREAVSLATGRKLVLHEPSLHAIEAMFARMGRRMAENNRLQAMMPEGAVVLENPMGSAPGFVVESEGKAVVAMPGVPKELHVMLHDRAIPWLVKRFALNSVIVTRVLHTVGMPESDVDARIADLFRAGKNPSIAVLAHPGLVDVKITAKAVDQNAARAMIEVLEPQVRTRLGDCIAAVDGGTLQASLGDALRRRGWTISTAESCTAGLAGTLIASVPGASDYYRGTVVAYANEMKSDLLDVDPSLIERHGAVSEEVAGAMASGARAKFGSTIAVATTGVAGPGGGTPEKPVGLVYIALAAEDGRAEMLRLKLPGDRELVQRRGALAAVTMAWRFARSV